MKKFFSLLAVLFLLVNIVKASNGSDVIFVEGEVSGLWPHDTVYVTGDIFISPMESLLITPGVVVQFLGSYRFNVHGQLQALAGVEFPIIFTVADTTGFHDSFSSQGGWQGIYFIADEDDEKKDIVGIFEHCYFEFAKTSPDSEIQHGGAIYIDIDGQYSFTHCTFYHNKSFRRGGAVYFENASPVFENCNFIANVSGHPLDGNEIYGYGGGICGVSSRQAVVRQCYFSQNMATGIGGALSFEFSIPLIQNNVFEDNYSALGGAFSILRSDAEITIANNLVFDNEATFFGGAIAILTANAILANNTIVSNHAAYGGGIYLNENAFPIIYNTILWGNTANAEHGIQVFAWDVHSLPVLYNSIIEGGIENIWSEAFTDECYDCIDIDPEFSLQEDHPYAPIFTSPAIMGGYPETEFLNLPPTDLAGNPRITNGIIDIGAYELDSIFPVQVINPGLITPRAMIYPNPVTANSKLQLFMPTCQNIAVSIINSRGQIIQVLFKGELQQGLHQLQLNGKIKSTRGIYYLLIETATSRETISFVVTSRI
jgi:hypothetical protein